MKHSQKLNIMPTEFPGGNPPTHPPATWLRSIFDPVVNTCIAISLPSSPQPLLLVTALAHLRGRTALPWEAAASFHRVFAPPAPFLLAYRKRLSQKARLATQPGAEPPRRAPRLLLGSVRGEWRPSFTRVHLLCGEGLHTHEGEGLPTSAWSVREGTVPASAQDSKRELPPRRSLASPPGHNQRWWRTVVFTQLLFRVHTYLEKNRRYSPIRYSKTTIPQGFYNPPGQHLSCSPSPRGKL